MRCWLAGLLLLSAPAAAQTLQWSEVETVVVKARSGPALWHITRGDSEVWLLGVVGAMPKDLDWNKQYLSELLDGAGAILLPPKANVNLLDIGWFLITHGSELSLPRGQALEASLPEPLRNRFVAARKALGRDEDRYRTDTPIRAALRLQQDYLEKAALSGSEPRETVESLASRKRIRSAPVTRFDAMDAVRDVLKLTPEQQHTCLSQAVEDVQLGLAHAGAAGRAWAVGDVRGVKANYAESRLGGCIIAAVQKISDINARNTTEYASAITAALNKPGKTIVVVNVGPLLRKGGVLEKLEAQHIAVEGPAD